MLYKLGVTKPEVARIQKALGVSATGYFGDKTRLAVIAFQKANAIEQDGKVGAMTWNLLFPEEINTPIKSQDSIVDLNRLDGRIPNKYLAQLSRINLYVPNPNVLHVAHFLAQCCHESSNFTIMEENLNYSRERLLEIFDKYFNNSNVDSYVRKPEKIANKVYANRNGNGDVASGDGWKFRGRGPIQTTFKNNYLRLQKWINSGNNHLTIQQMVDLIATPDLVKNEYALDSALFFFTDNEIWEIADNGTTDSIVRAVTKKVNGGTNGLADRIKLFKLFYSILK